MVNFEPCRVLYYFKNLYFNIMKNLILFFLTCVVGTGAFLAALTMKNPLPAFIVGFGVWFLFFYRMSRR